MKRNNMVFESATKRELASNIARILRKKESIPTIIHFMNKNNIDADKLHSFVKDASLPEQMNILAGIFGKDGNPLQLNLIKQFGRDKMGESYSMASSNTELLNAAIKRLLSKVSAQMDRLKSNGEHNTPYYRSLEAKYDTLMKKVN